MRLPFLQLESDIISHGAAEVSHLARCSIPQALGHIAMVRAWAVSHATDEAAPDGWVQGDASGRRIEAAAHWQGENGVLLQALIDAGHVRIEGGGHRVLNLEPYAKAWEQNRRSKERMRTARERSANKAVTNVNGGASGGERSAKFDGQTQTQTQTQRKKEEPPTPSRGVEDWSREAPPSDGAWTLPDAIDAVHREVMDGRPYAWDMVHDEKAATVLLSLCAAEGIPIHEVPEEAGRRFGRALVRSLWKFERGAGKAVTLRELTRRECWSINAEPPRQEREARNGMSGVLERVEVAVEPWDAMLAKRGMP